MSTTSTHAEELTPRGRRFLRRLTAATGGGMFMDGFVFATFAAAMAGKAHAELGVTDLADGFISASVLVGTLVGGLTLGYLTDRIGRRPMFTIDMMTFLGCAVLLFFVTASWQIVAIGLVLGLAIGADYSIGSPLLGEFAPARIRGNFLGILEILWNVGYVTAYLIGYLINTHWPDAWRFILGATVLPALACILLRHGLPESPRWLMSKGRRDEAATILREAMDSDDLSDLEAEPEESTRYGLLFTKDYVRRTIFACSFWSLIVLPYFALTYFQPHILRTMGLGKDSLAAALLGVVIALAGAATGWFLVDKVGRRPLLVVPMFVCAGFLALAATYERLPGIVGAICLFGYLYSYGVMSILPGVYPEEIFPSAVRATGVGVATAASRGAAAVGTFLLPFVDNAWGTPAVLVIMAAFSLLGGVMALAWAPETNGKALTETSHVVDPHAYGRRARRARHA